MVRLFFVCVICLIFLPDMLAQPDSVVLENITVRSLPWQDFAAGINVRSIAYDAANTNNLGQLLMTESPAYVRSYGAGQLTTLSFRGTSASQNAIFWEGININIISLGLSDFSLTPVALVDEVSLQMGAASSLLGSDVIGGSVHLQQHQSEENLISILAGVGSFGAIQNRFRSNFNHKTVTFQTKFFHQRAANNFPYQNPAKRGNPTEIMENAAYRQWGATQDIWWQLHPNHQIGLHMWYQQMDREIQPTFTGTNRDQQEDDSRRILLTYRGNFKKSKSEVKLARLEDRINFNGDLSVMPRYYFSYEHSWETGTRWQYRVGGNAQHLMADVGGYGRYISENRSDVYAAAIFQPGKKWLFTGSVRQPMVQGFNPPLSPSLGWKTAIGREWVWSGNISRSYRVPTLNDRYWSPGGNENLLPESGLHAETSFQFEAPEANISSEATIYYGSVKDWIIWMPGERFWSPSNIDHVGIYGLEYSVRWDITRVFKTHFNYNYNRSVRRLSAVDFFEGKQLPYVPLHQMKSGATYRWKNLDMNLTTIYTSTRFTSADNTSQLPHFFMLNIGVAGSMGDRWHFSGEINNLLNEDYQLMVNRAMPGRNVNFTIQHTFKFK